MSTTPKSTYKYYEKVSPINVDKAVHAQFTKVCNALGKSKREMTEQLINNYVKTQFKKDLDAHHKSLADLVK